MSTRILSVGVCVANAVVLGTAVGVALVRTPGSG